MIKLLNDIKEAWGELTVLLIRLSDQYPEEYRKTDFSKFIRQDQIVRSTIEGLIKDQESKEKQDAEKADLKKLLKELKTEKETETDPEKLKRLKILIDAVRLAGAEEEEAEK